jgi:hypothetical protein
VKWHAGGDEWLEDAETSALRASIGTRQLTAAILECLCRSVLIGQHHFRCRYKHEAQASEYFALKHTCSRCVLVSSQIDTKVALSN